MTENIAEREHQVRRITIGSRPPVRHRRLPDRFMLEMVRRVQPAFAHIHGVVRNRASVPISFQIGEATEPTDSYIFDAALVSIADLPTDGDTLTLDNGTATFVMEFDDDGVVTVGSYGVQIGATRQETFHNLLTAIRALEAGGIPARGTITFSGQPVDTETLEISDGVTSLVFEFESAAGITGDVEVLIGGTAEETLDNLVLAINTAGFGVFATKESATVIGLVNTGNPGAQGNVAITDAATNVAVDGMEGGLDPGSIEIDAENATPFTPSVTDPVPVLRLTHRQIGGGSGASVTSSNGTDVPVVADFASTTALSADRVTFRVGGSNVTDLTVQPGASVEFSLEAPANSDEYLAFYTFVPGATIADPELPNALVSEANVDCELTYRYGELKRFGRSDANAFPLEPSAVFVE